MILTTCAACAKPLEHDAPAHCVNCQTRYCSDRCLRYHAHRGGHDDKCEEIARGGGAEPYHAEKQYEESVADAVEECEDDTEGQTCYICLEDGSEEGLVRGCSCRGASGFAHVSCLARQAKILVEEAEERDLVGEAFDARWARWHTCRLCEQKYHGVVRGALGWACWRTYVGRPEDDETRGHAMTALGNGLFDALLYEDALAVDEARFSMMKRIGASEEQLLDVQTNLACTYAALGRLDEALSVRHDVYSARLKLDGEEQIETIIAANNYAVTLKNLEHFEEARSVLRKVVPAARRVLGESDSLTLKVGCIYGQALYRDADATLDDLREAVTIFEEIEPTARRVMGGTHPITTGIELQLRNARAALARETPSPGSP